MEIHYLAGPYTKGGPQIRLARYEAITFVAAKLIEKRLVVLSPLTMTHPIDLILAEDGATLGSDYWVDFDESFMRACSCILVLKLPGWEESSGVSRETKHFEDRGIQPKYLEPAEFGVTAEIEKFRAAFKET